MKQTFLSQNKTFILKNPIEKKPIDKIDYHYSYIDFNLVLNLMNVKVFSLSVLVWFVYYFEGFKTNTF